MNETVGAWMSLGDQLATPIIAAVSAAYAWSCRNKIQQVHVDINSRLTEMLALASRASHAEGLAEGVAISVVPAVIAVPPGTLDDPGDAVAVTLPVTLVAKDETPKR